MDNEIADEITKSAIRLASEYVLKEQNTLKKMINNRISKKDGCLIRVRWNVFATCRIINIMCKSSKLNTYFWLTSSCKDCSTVFGLMKGHKGCEVRSPSLFLFGLSQISS